MINHGNNLIDLIVFIRLHVFPDHLELVSYLFQFFHIHGAEEIYYSFLFLADDAEHRYPRNYDQQAHKLIQPQSDENNRFHILQLCTIPGITRHLADQLKHAVD